MAERQAQTIQMESELPRDCQQCLGLPSDARHASGAFRRVNRRPGHVAPFQGPSPLVPLPPLQGTFFEELQR